MPTQMADETPSCRFVPLPIYSPAVSTPKRYRILYGGAGSGKSVFTAMDLLYLCRRDPRRRVLVIRKVKNTIRLSTFQLFKDLIYDWSWEQDVTINKNEFRISFEDGGEIVHSGLDDREKLKSITGITDVWIEEATELDSEDIAQVDLRLRGLPTDMNGRITYTFNPVYTAREIFQYVGLDTEKDLPVCDHHTTKDVYIQHSTYMDNPHAGRGYEIAMDKMSGAMEEVYRFGRMARVDEPDQVIPYGFIKRGQEADKRPGTQFLGVDVARYGRDKTALASIKGNVLEMVECHDETSITRAAALVSTAISERRIDPCNVGVDAVGMGAGVVDNLNDMGYRVAEIISGASAVEDGTSMNYTNLRSQLWWTFREALREGRVHLAYCPQKLVEDLSAPRYRIQSGKTVWVEPKEKIKSRLGRSTDIADAAIYAWGVKELDISVESLGEYQNVKM